VTTRGFKTNHQRDISVETNKIKHDSKGFTLVEVMCVLMLLGLIVTMVCTHFNSSAMIANSAADDLVSSVSLIQSAYNSYNQDKGMPPAADGTGNALGNSAFVPVYLFIPRPASGFDGTYGVTGYFLGYQTGQASPNNGSYICARANVTGNDPTFQAIVKASTILSANKFFYNTSCPATTNMGTPTGATQVIITEWMTRT
jgi:prepilin-type N-terminal cleavage/methylation domain-containing protein